MPKNKIDPLGRNHATVQRKSNRSFVDAVCDYILEHEHEDFHNGDQRPTWNHIYYSACVVMYGMVEANKMLKDAQKEWDSE